MQKRRIGWIDIAKGIGIWLVVLYHFPQINYTINPKWGGYIVSFYMIYFFMLSGLFFKPISLSKRIHRLMIPYLCFYALAVVVYILKSLVKGLSIDIYHLCLPFIGKTHSYENAPIWFLLCLANLILISFILVRLFNKKQLHYVIWIIGYVGYLFGKHGILKDYHLNVTFLVFPFFIGAYLYRKWLVKKRHWSIYVAALFVSVFVYSLKPDWCNISQNDIPLGFFRFVIISLLASYGLIGVSMILEPIKYIRIVLSYYGRNSLIVLCTHMMLMCIPTFFYNHFGNTWITAMISFMLILTLEIPIIEVVNRKMKFLIGK